MDFGNEVWSEGWGGEGSLDGWGKILLFCCVGEGI